uniref:cytochrome c biogenesis protein CcsA n=1 Tax=Prevotella sp. TaxID=59823 RepID=UPI00402570E2
MKHLKNLILVVATAIILILITATIVESSKGTAFVRQHIYTSAWFVVLWAALAVAAAVYIVLRKNKSNICTSVLLVHASFLVILLGAFTSWNMAESGTIHLRQNETTSTMKDEEGKTKELGFELSLKNFNVVNYPGTDAPMDYVTMLTANTQEIKVSMNNIGSFNGYRFIQSGYDSDMQGTTLGVYHDPWGIGITYTGYALLFISLIATMVSKKTRIRHLYRKALSLQGAKAWAVTALLAVSSFATSANAQEMVKIDGDIADDFGKICVLYNSRITPINTVATSFVTKLCGKPTWDGLSSNQVFAGWIFDVPYWETVKMIEIKEKKAQELLGINGKWASFDDFWDNYNNYKLDAPLKKAYKDGDTKLQKQLRDADEKFNIIRMLYGGEMLKMFPYAGKQGHMQWFAPGQPLGNLKLDEKELVFIKKSMDYLAESIITGDKARAEEIAKKIYSYQHVRGKAVVPTKFRIYTETFYNKTNAQRLPVMLYLTLSLLLAIMSTLSLNNGKQKKTRLVSSVLTWVMLIHTTLLLALRWYVSGHLPMSNGYETMQFMAWATLIVTLVMQKRFLPVKQFGPLLSSFALLVAMITDGNPQITQLMPVLQSPLLSVHVMVIMFSYALFGLTALIGLQGLIAHHRKQEEKEQQLAALSQFLLYPAVALIAIGIFIGAIWANVSWGRYWSWDSKETWALITMLIYSVPLHADIKWLRKAQHMHIYMLLAFLSVLMTYFGVNYFLSGMHSYA